MVSPAFTIAKLLVVIAVIVVIAILAIITIVVYKGISDKAIEASLQSDLSNDSTPVAVTTTPITAIAAITGTTQVGSVLTAGALTPSAATATYEWQSATTSDGTYTNIASTTTSTSSATANISSTTARTYTLVISDLGKYIKVVATGTGNYSGTQTSAASTVVSDTPQTFTLDTTNNATNNATNDTTTYPITNDSTPVTVTTTPITAIAAITGTTQVGSVLTAGALTPSGATVTYEWQSATTSGGTYTNIASATASTYTLVIGDLGKYIKLVATATGSYSGTQTSAASSVITTPLTAIAAITGTTTVGSVLTAGALTPSGATVTYEWQSATTSDGTYTNIASATASTYTLVIGDLGKYIKVVATGTGNYSGTQTSAASTVVSSLISFVMAWGGTGGDWGLSLVRTSDGGYAVAGLTYSYGAGSSDMFLAKYTSDGTLSWSRTWGGTGSDYGNSLVQTSDGGYAITGRTTSYGTGSDMFLAKYTSDGTLSWSRTWGGVDWEYGNSIVQTSDGGYAVTGFTGSYGTGGDMFLAKYTSDGTLSWNRTWGGAGGDYGYSLIQTSDGGYAITGGTGSYGTGGDMFLAKYTSDGTLSWSRTWGGTSYNSGYSLVQTSDGGYAITGSTTSYGAGGYDTFLAKYTSDGTLSWSRTWGGAEYDDAISLVQTSDGGYAITGETDSYGASVGSGDMSLIKYDSDGVIANCSAPMCQSPTADVSSPTADVSSPTADVSSPTADVSSPTADVSSPSATSTIIVAP